MENAVHHKIDYKPKMCTSRVTPDIAVLTKINQFKITTGLAVFRQHTKSSFLIIPIHFIVSHTFNISATELSNCYKDLYKV